MSKLLVKKYKKRSIILALMLAVIMIAFVRNDVKNISKNIEATEEIYSKDAAIEELNSQVNELTFVLDVQQEHVNLLKNNNVKLEKLLTTKRIRYIPLDSNLISMRRYKNYIKYTK